MRFPGILRNGQTGQHSKDWQYEAAALTSLFSHFRLPFCSGCTVPKRLACGESLVEFRSEKYGWDIPHNNLGTFHVCWSRTLVRHRRRIISEARLTPSEVQEPGPRLFANPMNPTRIVLARVGALRASEQCALSGEEWAAHRCKNAPLVLGIDDRSCCATEYHRELMQKHSLAKRQISLHRRTMHKLIGGQHLPTIFMPDG